MLIKTNLKIGKFIENSRVDNFPIVEVTEEELIGVDETLYEKMPSLEDHIQGIMNYPPSIKIRGFEEVVEEHKKFETETILPTRGSEKSAGYDFYSKETVTILPGQKHLFWTDVKSYMMNKEVLEIYVRSSVGINLDLCLANGVTIIDTDYYSNIDNDGNISVCLRNESEQEQTIEAGDRIAQGIFKNFLVADNISSTKKRNGGIGTTKK